MLERQGRATLNPPTSQELLGPSEPLGDLHDIREGPAQFLSAGREGVPNGGRRCLPGDPLYDSFAFQLAKTICEHLR